MEHESDSNNNGNWCAWYSHQRIGKGTGGIWNGRTSRDHPNYWIIEIGQNTEKSRGDLRRLAGTQTPVEDHYLTQWEKLNKENNTNTTTNNNDNI